METTENDTHAELNEHPDCVTAVWSLAMAMGYQVMRQRSADGRRRSWIVRPDGGVFDFEPTSDYHQLRDQVARCLVLEVLSPAVRR